MEVALSAILTPLLLVALTFLGPFAQDPESALVRPLPKWLCRTLRDVPLTWELFSLWEFGITALAVTLTQPAIAWGFLEKRGLTELRYGPRAEQTLQLFSAKASAANAKAEFSPGERGAPLVIFVHGGSWSHSRSWMYGLVGRRLSDMGFSAAVLRYGQYPASTAPDMVEDLRSAVQWLRTFGGQHGIDTSRLFLLGHSSGGHLCTLAALTGGALGLRGLAAISSPMDIGDHFRWEEGRGVADISALYPANGGDKHFADLSPTRLVGQLSKEAVARLLPPMLLGHGTADFVVPPQASERFADAARDAGADVEVQRWPSLGHFSALGAMMGFSSAGEEAEEAVRGVEAFMRRCLEPDDGEGEAVAAEAELEMAAWRVDP